MTATPAIRVDGLWKEYRLGGRGPTGETFYDLISGALRAPFRGRPRAQAVERFWALRDVSFDVASGEVLGIIGRNGAGKSTLLKILTRITDPTRGRIEIRGRVASLLEIGTGFHPELTGRENIFLNGSILGMSRREIARKFDEIVAFAEIERFLDTPVKRYSSGMYVRLAFAVAAHLEPDVLIVDEVLAVGDASFQKKCLAKMGEVRGEGRTVLFVSHNLTAVAALCTTAILLEGGEVATRAAVDEAVRRYTRISLPATDGVVDLEQSPVRASDALPVFLSARLLAGNGSPSPGIASGGGLVIELELDPHQPVADPRIEVGCNDAFGKRIFTIGNFLSAPPLAPLSGRTKLRCEVADLPLAPGSYALTFCFGTRQSAPFDLLEDALPIEVAPAPYYGPGIALRPELGPLLVRSRWTADFEGGNPWQPQVR